MALDINPLEPGTDQAPFEWFRQQRQGWKSCELKTRPKAGLGELGRRKRRRMPTKPWEQGFQPTVLRPDGLPVTSNAAPMEAPTVFDVPALAPAAPAPVAPAYPTASPYGAQPGYPTASPYGAQPGYPTASPYGAPSYAESIGYSQQQLYAPPGYGTGYQPDYSAMPQGMTFDDASEGQLGFFGPLLKIAGSVVGGVLGKKKKKAAPAPAAAAAPAPQVIMQPAPQPAGTDGKAIVPMVGIGAVLLVLLMRRGDNK